MMTEPAWTSVKDRSHLGKHPPFAVVRVLMSEHHTWKTHNNKRQPTITQQ
jgi:hypothetical protein